MLGLAMTVTTSCSAKLSPGDADYFPFLDADTSADSSHVAEDMLPAIAAQLRYDLAAGLLSASPDSFAEVTRWFAEPAPKLTGPQVWSPTSPPFWRLVASSAGGGRGEYLVASYYFGGAKGILEQDDTWGHACGKLTVTPANPPDTHVAVEVVDCPDSVPERLTDRDVETAQARATR